MGTEEDGVDEAGRATEPSLMVAPSSRDIDPDEETVEATADNEVMTGADEGELESSAGSVSDDADVDTADEADQGANGHAGTASHPRVPLPAAGSAGRGAPRQFTRLRQAQWSPRIHRRTTATATSPTMRQRRRTETRRR